LQIFPVAPRPDLARETGLALAGVAGFLLTRCSCIGVRELFQPTTKGEEMKTKQILHSMALLGMALALAAGLWGVMPVPVARAATYTQDFNTLASSGTSSTLPSGWAFSESESRADTNYVAGTGSSATGDTYSFGADGSSERAFGGLRSGTLIPTIGAQFQNDTGMVIVSLEISYYCEQWRSGVANRGSADRLDFQYSTDATSLTTGTWTDIDALDCLTTDISDPSGPKDGNDAAYRTRVTGSIAGLNIADDATYWIRWTDYDISSSDDGLAIDDFSLSDSPTAVTLASFDATPQDDAILVIWETAMELDNVGFNLYRSESAEGPYTLLNGTLIPPQFPGEVMGGVYEYLDTDVLPGVPYYYKLEDIDVKGVSTFHGPVSTSVITAPTAIGLRGISARGVTLSLVLEMTTILGVVAVFRRKR
jgi:hypothetical protein